jgi:hypothetical protein
MWIVINWRLDNRVGFRYACCAGILLVLICLMALPVLEAQEGVSADILYW